MKISETRSLLAIQRYKSWAVAEMGDRARKGPKSGGCCAPFRGGGSWVPI